MNRDVSKLELLQVAREVMEEELVIEPCVHCYHVYKDIWEAAIAEELPCEQEIRNTKDRYAAAVKKMARWSDIY